MLQTPWNAPSGLPEDPQEASQDPRDWAECARLLIRWWRVSISLILRPISSTTSSINPKEAGRRERQGLDLDEWSPQGVSECARLVIGPDGVSIS